MKNHPSKDADERGLQSFDEGSPGSLEVGKYADMVALGKGLLTAPPETIIDIPIDITIGGWKNRV